jgi:hypothetical protein
LYEKTASPGAREYAQELQAAKRAVKPELTREDFHDLLASIYLQFGQSDLAVWETRWL